MKIDFQEKIDDYVLGKMSAEDRDKFEKEVSQDIEKQEQLKLTQNVSTAIKSRNEKLAMMQKWEQERIASKRKIMAWTSSAVGIAAVLLVGVFLFVPKEDDKDLSLFSPIEIGVEYPAKSIEYIGNTIKNQESDENGIFLHQIKRMINDKEYEKAMSLIDEIRDSLKNRERLLRDTISVKSKEKLNDFTELSNIEKSIYELQWLEIEAYIGLNDVESAIVLLKEFRKEEGKYKIQADSLLNVLK